jgi:hypothetical protein
LAALKGELEMRLIKFILLLVFGAILLLGVIGGVLNVTQILSINLSTPSLLIISLIALAIYLLLINSELRWQLSRKRQLQERIDKLALFRQDAITKLYAFIPIVAEFQSWLDRYKNWEESLVVYLKDNFPFAVFEMFEDLGMIPGEQFTHASKDPAIAAQHLHHLQMLAKFIRILERLIEENTNLLPEAKPSLSELLKWLPGDRY